MSFFDIGAVKESFVGIDNYTKLLKDKVFHTAIINSLKYTLITCALLIPFPMIFAVMIDSRLVKAKGLWKALLYVPSLTSVVISGTIFRLMFTEYPTGQMNVLLQALGMEPIKWLKMGGTAMFAMVLLCCWRWTGVNMLYFMSGLKQIDTAVYEAADIDGATAMKKFIYVTLPSLKPTIVYVLTISVYAGLSMFLESFMLWAENASPQNIGLTIVGYLYRRGIEKTDMGYASAVGLVLMAIALTINIIQLIANGTFKRRDD